MSRPPPAGGPPQAAVGTLDLLTSSPFEDESDRALLPGGAAEGRARKCVLEALVNRGQRGLGFLRQLPSPRPRHPGTISPPRHTSASHTTSPSDPGLSSPLPSSSAYLLLPQWSGLGLRGSWARGGQRGQCGEVGKRVGRRKSWGRGGPSPESRAALLLEACGHLSADSASLHCPWFVDPPRDHTGSGAPHPWPLRGLPLPVNS